MSTTATKPQSTKKHDDDEVPLRAHHPVEPIDVKSGHIMAFTYYVKIEEPHDGGVRLQTNNLDTPDNRAIEFRGRDLVERSRSADLFYEEKIVNRSDAAALLTGAGDAPFTVSFLKQGEDGTGTGEERLLRGRFLYIDPNMGRSVVIDLDLDINDKRRRIAQVDHRTIQWLILDGCKYVVGKKKR